MPENACACGYQADSPDGLLGHLGEAFIPRDDTAPDGQVHAELAREAAPDGPLSLACTCGLTASGPAALDEHLLQAFTPADGIGLDGSRHAPFQDA